MGKFSKIFHHIESKDLRNKYEQKKVAKIKEQKKLQEEIIRNVEIKKYAKSAMEHVKYNWRSAFDEGAELREGMTTSDVATISSPANPDEVLNDTPLDNADDFAPGARGDVADFYNATVGTSVKSSGSGSGNNGGFDIGNHLAFDGDGSTDGARWMITKPIDTTNLDHIVMSIITGNDSNGGETPDDSGEGLHLYYKTPEMNDFIPINYFPEFTGSDYRGGDIGYPDLDKLLSTTDGPTFVDHTIIPVGGGSPTLQDYSKYIPSYARGKGTQFLLYQFASSGTGKDNYGVKNISYRRKYPIQVVAPLDTPEASSFIRGADQSSTPKKRKKAVDDKLEASDEYTTAKFGNEFPGQEVRVGGDDPFKSAKIGDDVKPSPQTKEGVKKGFNDFNNQATTVRGAPTAEPESEPAEDPEVIATTQSKTATNDDGEPIEPKPVGSGAVQGADATNLDQQEPEATEPETTEPEIPDPDPEDLKDLPDQNQPEEVLNQQLEDKASALEKALVFNVTKDLNGFKNLVKVAKFAVQGFLGMMTIADRLNPFKQQDTNTNELQGGLSVLLNSLDIAMSVMDGKVSKSNPTAAQINTYKNSILPDIFKDTASNYIPISDIRHEYADGNIYVERIDGKAVVRDNTSGIKQDLTNKRGGVGGEYDGFSQVGGGYSQFIIPKDGGEPYVHFYDYNYHNINNDIDVSFEGGIIQSGGKVNANTISASLSNLIHQLRPSNTKLNIPARAKTSLIGYFTNFKDVLSALQTTSTLEGWPPGIHGAALTDITIPLSKLPKETQEMIAAHPLSWTPERMENMSEDYLYEQMDILLKKEGIVYSDSDSGDSYFKGVIKILNSKGINADPKFVEAFTGIDATWRKGQELQKEYKEIPNKPGFGLAHKKAEEDWRSLQEDKKSATSREELNKYISKNVKIPNPETDGDDRPDWSEWINSKEGKKHDQLIAQQKELSDAAQDYYRTTTKPAADKLFAYQGTLKKEGDKVVGTKEQIAKFRKLAAEYNEASNEYDRLFSLQDEPMNEAGALLSAFIEDYDRRMAIWKPYLEEIDRVYSEISEIFDMFISEAYEKYLMTTGDENEDGVIEFVNGGDYTDEKGKTYPGYGRFYEDIDARIAENNELADQYWDTYSSYGYRYLAETIDPFLINKQFKGKTVNWSPNNRGEGSGSKPDPRSSYAGTGADAATFSFDGTNNKKKRPFNAHFKPKGKNLFERVSKLREPNQFFNQDDIKPEFPENPPPKLDPKTGMHPQYGKKAKRYVKLDPISANSMPLTGDPEIDAVVNKQKTINKIKKMARNK